MNDDPIDAVTDVDSRPQADAEQVEQVKEAAVSFSDGLLTAFRLEGSSSASIDGIEIEVRIDATDGPGHDGPNGLGLLIGPGGRTLLAIQDLARVAAQRRLGDHETRLRIDVAGYREKRRVALERFARGVAEHGQGVGRRPFARPDAVGRPQGDPRRADGDRRCDQPVRGRGPEPADHRQPGLTARACPTTARCSPHWPSRSAWGCSDGCRWPTSSAHSDAFVGALVGVTATVVDLGTGGGVPGLVIAVASAGSVAGARRPADHAYRPRQPSRAPTGAGRSRAGDPAEAATLPRRLADTAIGAVVARGYGPPERVVHDAVPLLAPGGLLVVSEPPTGTARWSDDLLAAGGLSRIDHDDARVVVLQRGSSQ